MSAGFLAQVKEEHAPRPLHKVTVQPNHLLVLTVMILDNWIIEHHLSSALELTQPHYSLHLSLPAVAVLPSDLSAFCTKGITFNDLHAATQQAAAIT